MATSKTTVTDEQVEALRTEAGEAGDLAQVALCDAALGGDDEARAECARVILAAQRGTDDQVLRLLADTMAEPDAPDEDDLA